MTAETEVNTIEEFIARSRNPQAFTDEALIERARNMRVGILKIGKSTYFDPSGWKAIGADIEVRMLIQILCPYIKEMHFWGPYQLKKKGKTTSEASEAAPDLPANLKFYDRKTFMGSDYAALAKQVEDARLDVMIVVNGPHSINNRSMQVFERYVYPHIEIINRTRVPWLYLYSDPRYHWRARELARAPQKILCQYPLRAQQKNVANTRVSMDYEYLDISGFWRLNTPKVDYPIDGRESVLRLIGNSKSGYWREWSENYIPGLTAAGAPWEVWGLWPEAPADDPRYRQVSIKQGWDVLTKTKYVLIMVTPSALDRGYPITGRYWELAMTDAFVFVNKSYDHRGQLIPLDDYARVKDGAELAAKMAELDANPDMHRELIERQRSRFTREQESTWYLGRPLLEYMCDAIDRPEQEAFATAELKPDVCASYSQIDLTEQQLQGKALAWPDDHKMTLGHAVRPHRLLKRITESNPDRTVTLEELFELYSRDSYFNVATAAPVNAAEPGARRDPRRSAVHVISVLHYRGLPLVDVPYVKRDLDYDGIIAQFGKYKPIDRSRRSIGAKRGTAPKLTVSQAQAVEQASSSPALAVSQGQAIGQAPPKRERKPMNPNSRAKRVRGDAMNVASGNIPMRDRRLVALVSPNPFKSGTATAVHFDQVAAAGPTGIGFDEFAQAIEQTRTNGRQTGLTLARWNFNYFVRLGYAKQIVRDDATGECRDYRVPVQAGAGAEAIQEEQLKTVAQWHNPLDLETEHAPK